MKKRIFIFLAGAVLILQGCATSPTTKISAVATMDQKVGYGDTIVSQKKHFVSLTPYTQLDSAISNIGVAKDKTKFLLAVENCGDETIEVGFNNISVIFVPKTGDGAPRSIPVQPWKEFLEEFKTEYDKEELEYIYTTLYEVYMSLIGSTGFGGGSGGGGGDMEEGGPGPTGKLGELEYDIETMRNQKDILEEMLPSVLVKEARILPGKSYSGIIVFNTSDLDAAAEGNFRISMAIDGEEYRFVFRRAISR